MNTTRRGFITGLIALSAAPAIVRASSLMPVRMIDLYDTRCLWDYCIGSDSMILRVDRASFTMIRPPHHVAMEVPLKVAKSIFGPNAEIFGLQPERQVACMKEVSAAELRAHGFEC